MNFPTVQLVIERQDAGEWKKVSRFTDAPSLRLRTLLDDPSRLPEEMTAWQNRGLPPDRDFNTYAETRATGKVASKVTHLSMNEAITLAQGDRLPTEMRHDPFFNALVQLMTLWADGQHPVRCICWV